MSVKSKRKILILLIVVCQPLITDCSRHVYAEPSFKNIITQAEKQKMDDFISVGTVPLRMKSLKLPGNILVFPIAWAVQQ
jgi:hypothetical protein